MTMRLLGLLQVAERHAMSAESEMYFEFAVQLVKMINIRQQVVCVHQRS
jgi:hypothetical protein